jgi:osmoprotectant transport system substrate-binding protein
VLKDDKGLFPADNLGLIVRSDVLKQYPQIATIIDPIAAKMTTDAFLSLNKMVEIDSMKPADVAATWLQQNGF